MGPLTELRRGNNRHLDKVWLFPIQMYLRDTVKSIPRDAPFVHRHLETEPTGSPDTVIQSHSTAYGVVTLLNTETDRPRGRNTDAVDTPFDTVSVRRHPTGSGEP